MHTRLLVSALLLALAVTATPAQRHPVWAVTGFGGPPPLFSLGRIDLQGSVTTIFPPVSSLRPWTEAVTMDTDNTTYVVAVHYSLLRGNVLRMSASGTILSSIYLPTGVPPRIGLLNDVLVDQNGDVIVLEGQGAVPSRNVYKISAGQVTTLATNLPFDPKNFIIDIDTGDYIIQSMDTLWRLSRDGQSVSQIRYFQNGLASQVTQHLRTGDIFMATGSNLGSGILRYTPGGQASTIVGGQGFYSWVVCADRASAASPRIVAGTIPLRSPGNYFIDLNTQAITTLRPTPNFGHSHIFPDRGRNVQTVKSGTRQWNIRLSFPGEFANGYVIGLSLSRTRPGVGLPDGRHIALNPDALTSLSVTGGLGGLLQGHAGRLDPSGSARAVFSLASFPQLKGMRLWIQALTFNVAAPLGIQTIADPVVLVVE